MFLHEWRVGSESRLDFLSRISIALFLVVFKPGPTAASLTSFTRSPKRNNAGLYQRARQVTQLMSDAGQAANPFHLGGVRGWKGGGRVALTGALVRAPGALISSSARQ